jgi:hypothetical protein
MAVLVCFLISYCIIKIYSAMGFNTPPLGAVKISNTDKNW